jgi:hypothetical protein
MRSIPRVSPSASPTTSSTSMRVDGARGVPQDRASI